MQAFSATSARCLETLLPYCAAEGVAGDRPTRVHVGHRANPPRPTARLDEIIASGKPAVVCGHGETIDEAITYVSGRLGTPVPVGPLDKGSFVVFHTADGDLVATEHHD